MRGIHHVTNRKYEKTTPVIGGGCHWLRQTCANNNDLLVDGREEGKLLKSGDGEASDRLAWLEIVVVGRIASNAIDKTNL